MTDFWAVLGLAVFSTALGGTVFLHGMRYIPVQHTSIVGLLEPACAPVFAFVFLAERPSLWTLLGGALILGGAVLVVLFGGRRGGSAGSPEEAVGEGRSASQSAAGTPAGEQSRRTASRRRRSPRRRGGGSTLGRSTPKCTCKGPMGLLDVRLVVLVRNAIPCPSRPRSPGSPRAARWTCWRPARRATLPRAHARGMPKRGASATLGRPGRGVSRHGSGGLWREPGVTILLIYKRLWPDPG